MFIKLPFTEIHFNNSFLLYLFAIISVLDIRTHSITSGKHWNSRASIHLLVGYQIVEVNFQSNTFYGETLFNKFSPCHLVQRKLKIEMTGPDLLVRRDLVRLPQDPEIVFYDFTSFVIQYRPKEQIRHGTALIPTQWGSETNNWKFRNIRNADFFKIRF